MNFFEEFDRQVKIAGQQMRQRQEEILFGRLDLSPIAMDVEGSPLSAGDVESYLAPLELRIFGYTCLERSKDEITFNGSPISDVISYDVDSGEVHYYERDWRTGNMIPDEVDATGYRTQRSRGKVEVIKKYVPPPSYGGEAGGSPSAPYDPYDWVNQTC